MAGGDLALDDTTVTGGDLLQEGGAIRVQNATLTLTNSTISGNRARDNNSGSREEGGGIYFINSTGAISNSTLSNNEAYEGGGFWNSFSTVTVESSTISNNTVAQGQGGGGLVVFPGGTLTITNSTIANNSARREGAIGIAETTGNTTAVTLINTTVTGNSATNDNGGIGSYTGASLTLQGSIVSGNNAGGINHEIYSEDGVVSSGGNVVGYGGSSRSSGFTPSGTDVIPSGPLSSVLDTGCFGTPYLTDNGGPTQTVNLVVGSPAIDLSASGPASGSDQRGVIRPVDGDGAASATEYDAGAVEYNGAVPLFVDTSAAGSNNGTSWANAYTTLQDALAAATSGDEIWVAEGIYYPDEGGGQTDDNIASTFTLKNEVALYGDFPTGGSSFSGRDCASNVTVLSGDLEQNDTTDANGVVTDPANQAGNNASHVVTGSGTDASAILDGFTITAGNFNGTFPTGGAGMYNDNGTPTLANLIFTGNSANFGGGLFNNASSPTLTNVTFTGNSATVFGGAMFNHTNSSPTLRNVLFSGNRAGDDGGALLNFSNSSPTLTNVTLSGNWATNDGGAIANYANSDPTIQNSIVWNNRASDGTDTASASIYNNDPVNSIPVIGYSLVQGWNPGGTTLDGTTAANDPLFVTPVAPASAPTTAGDLRLAALSPAIDAGDNSAISGVDSDLDGEPRITGSTVDLGAYELEASEYQNQCADSLVAGETYYLGQTGARITVDTLGSLTELCATLVPSNPPSATPEMQTGWYWNLSATNSGNDWSLTLSLPVDESKALDNDELLCRYDGSSWDCGSTATSTGRYVTRTAVTQLSPWVVATAAPLAVTLSSFEAQGNADHVVLTWQTVAELETLGFRLLRAPSADGEAVAVTAELILATGEGSTYEWADSDVAAGTSYWYWLEAVGMDGRATRHGPVSASVGAPTAVTLGRLGSRAQGSSLPLAMLGLGLVALGLVVRRRR